MTLHLYPLSRDRPGDFKLIKAIARVHLAAWMVIPLMQTIMYQPELTSAAKRADYLEGDTKSLKTEKEVRFVVVIDDALTPDEDDEYEDDDKEDVGSGHGGRPKGRVIAAMKYYLVPSTGPHPDTDTQKEIDRRSNAANMDTASAATHPSPSDSHMNDALSNLFVEKLVAIRQEVTALIGTHVLIDNIYTDPAHHRRGAGAMLMRVATQHADELGWPSMLEASPLGMKLYESAGYEVLPGKDIWIDLKRWENGGDKGVGYSEKRLVELGGERRSQDGWYAQVVMVRAANSRVQ